MSEAIINEHIREYNFAVPGTIDRHIPGIPGTWPFGSRVQVDEDTNQVVAVWPEGAAQIVPKPIETEKQEEQAKTAPETPSALAKVEAEVQDLAQQLLDTVKQS